MASEQTDTPVLDVLAAMTAASIDATSLDSEEVILARIAALVASIDAAVIAARTSRTGVSVCSLANTCLLSGVRDRTT